MHQMPPGDADTVLAVVLAEDFAPLAKRKRLTRAQAARVRSLIEDEGCSKREARALVLFEDS